MNTVPVDLSSIMVIALLGIVAYWAVHWFVTRPPGDKSPVVGKRPPVAPMSQHGRMSISAFGTYAGSVAVGLAKEMVRANCPGQVGGFLIMELNRERQRELVEEFPRGFRVVWGGSPLAKLGLGNEPIDRVNTPEMRTRWASDLRKTVTRFCALVRRPGSLHPAMDPSIVISLVSTGGHLLLGIEGARMLHKEFPRADFYGVTIWPEQAAQQRELIKALQLHAEKPVFRYWLVTNNLLDRARNDRAVAMLFACLTQAHRVLPRTEDVYNLLSTIYPQTIYPDDGTGVGVLRFWERPDVAVYPTPLPPVDYLIVRDDVVVAVLDGIAAIEADASTKTILLETPLGQTRRYVIVNVALRQPYLADLANDIRERLADAGWFKKDPHRTLIFSSLGEDLKPSTRYITVSVMSLEMATAGIAGVIEMAPAEPVSSEVANFATQAPASEVALDSVQVSAPKVDRRRSKPLVAPNTSVVNGSTASAATKE